MLQFAALIFFPLLMAWAAMSDMLTMTISNRISIALVILFVVMAFASGLSWTAMGYHLSCGLLVLLITFTMFALGWIGGGDAKLAAATAVAVARIPERLADGPAKSIIHKWALRAGVPWGLERALLQVLLHTTDDSSRF